MTDRRNIVHISSPDFEPLCGAACTPQTYHFTLTGDWGSQPVEAFAGAIGRPDRFCPECVAIHTFNTTEIRVPACPSDESHGLMTLRPDDKQTYEQKWCGTWYDCLAAMGGLVVCRSSILVPSADLDALKQEQEASVQTRLF